MEKKVTPMALATKAACAPVCQEYDWQKQSVKYDVCKAGSMFRTGATGLPGGTMEDWNQD